PPRKCRYGCPRRPIRGSRSYRRRRCCSNRGPSARPPSSEPSCRTLLGADVLLLGYMDEEVRLLVAVRLLEVAVRRDSLEPDLLHQTLHVRLAQREHVQVEYRAVREAVTEPRERLVDVLGCRRHVLAAIVVTMRRLDLLVENRVVVALIEDQDAVVAQRRVVLRERLAAIVLV